MNADKVRLANNKKEQAKLISDFIVKARLAIKVAFGPDSTEYEMAGGTRASDRKKPHKKVKQSK